MNAIHPDGQNGQGQPDPSAGRGRNACKVEWLVSWFGLPESLLAELGVRDAHGNRVAIPYRDQAGEELFVRYRITLFGGVRFHQPSGVRLRPYGLWRLAKARKTGWLIIVEGESDCWALWHHDFPAIGLPGNTGPTCLSSEDVEGIREIYVVNEKDPGGQHVIATVPKRLRELGYKGRLLELKLPEGYKDPADVHRLAAGAFRSILEQAMAGANELHPSSPQPPLPFPDPGQPATPEPAGPAQIAGKKPELPLTSQLVALVRADGLEWFKDERGNAWVRLPERCQSKIVRTSDLAFSDYLGNLWEDSGQGLLGEQTEKATIRAIARYARGIEPPQQVYIRRAVVGRTIWIDLCRSDGLVVKITADGWEVVAKPDVNFYRVQSAEPLPVPIRGGCIDVTWDHVNITDPGQRMLFIVYVLFCWGGEGTYPVLLVNGSEGSGKSSTTTFLKKFTDPHDLRIQREIPDQRTLLVSSMACLLHVYNNIDDLSRDKSSLLCCVVEGLSSAHRTLQTDTGLTVLHAHNPVAITAVEDVATRPDFLRRCLCIRQQPMPKGTKRPDRKRKVEFVEDQPYLFGAYCDVLVGVLKHLDEVPFDDSFGLTDFAEFGQAVEMAMGWPEGSFCAAYRASQEEADDVAAEAASWGQVICDILSSLPTRSWKGTAKDLLKLLNEKTGGDQQQAEGWPKQPHHLSGRLKSHKARLARRGIEVDFGRESGGNRIRWVSLTLTETADQVGIP